MEHVTLASAVKAKLQSNRNKQDVAFSLALPPRHHHHHHHHHQTQQQLKTKDHRDEEDIRTVNDSRQQERCHLNHHDHHHHHHHHHQYHHQYHQYHHHHHGRRCRQCFVGDYSTAKTPSALASSATTSKFHLCSFRSVILQLPLFVLLCSTCTTTMAWTFPQSISKPPATTVTASSWRRHHHHPHPQKQQQQQQSLRMLGLSSFPSLSLYESSRRRRKRRTTTTVTFATASSDSRGYGGTCLTMFFLSSSSSSSSSTSSVTSKIRPWLTSSSSSSSSSRPFVGSLALAAAGRARRAGPSSSSGGKGKGKGQKEKSGGNVGDVEEDDDEDEDDLLMRMMMMEDGSDGGSVMDDNEDDREAAVAAAAAAAAASSDQDVEEMLLASLGNAGNDDDDDDDDDTVVASYNEHEDGEEGDEEVQEDNDEEEEDYDDVNFEVDDFEDDDEEDEDDEEEDDDNERAVTVASNYYDDELGEYDNEDATARLYQNLEDDDDDDDVADSEQEKEYPLEDEPLDPNYQIQKQLLEETTKATDQWRREEEFDELDYIMNQMTPEEAEEMEQTPFQRQVEERAKNLILTEQDVLDYLGGDENNLERAVAQVSDLMDDDPYPRHDTDGVPNLLEQDIGVTDDDMEALDQAWKTIRRSQQLTDPWDKVSFKDMNTDWGALPNQTLVEMEACLEELGGSAYNVTRWLLYDLDFNVSNLFLAAIKHNPKAPVLFQHWYPQLVTYERYQHARDRNFDFSWDDVQQADISELEYYYAGFGYDEIPLKAPAETGIISVEELDEEELRMAAFENWMADVYNPELDRKDFDDDDIRDEDNVFSDFYDPPQHPDIPSYEDALDDIKEWVQETGGDEYDDEDDDNEGIRNNANGDTGTDNDGDWSEENRDEMKAYRNLLGRDYKYKVVRDDEFTKLFRGHLIVACTGEDSDLEVAETITRRMDEQFGKQVFVETRVMAHARPEDNVFEVWLESYEIDLLHSKKRAMSNNKNWKGPAECDEAQIEYLVDRVGFLISDESRYSYRMDLEPAE